MHVIMSKYKMKFECQPIWQTIVVFLPAESVLSKKLRRHKNDSIGNIPRGKNSLDLQRILEGMLSLGDDRVKYLDSNEPGSSSLPSAVPWGRNLFRGGAVDDDRPSLPSPWHLNQDISGRDLQDRAVILGTSLHTSACEEKKLSS